MNALPLLEEIKTALKNLLTTGSNYVIYSNKMPTTLEDRYFLQEVLGKGKWFMYERVLHTKAVAFNTLIPGVWIELIFSERDPKEPILEMVRIDFSPLSFTLTAEDLEVGLKKLKRDMEQFKNFLPVDAMEVAEALEEFLNFRKASLFEDSDLLRSLTYYLLTDDVLVLENKEEDKEIVSTNYWGLWLEKNRRSGEYTKLYIGDFPHLLKPTAEDIKRALSLLEERKERFLPKYQKRKDIPLL